MISQGDVYWIDFGEPHGSAPGFRRPVVIVQNDTFNRSRINTVVGCVITSNLGRAAAPGNILLGRGEANLPRRSVVNVSQVVTVDKAALTVKLGSLSKARVSEILDGISLVLLPSDS